MQTVSQSTKSALRKHYLSLRAKLKRKVPIPHLSPEHELILSYASFNSEFPTGMLNQKLAEQNKLVLPKIEGNTLQLYRVDNLGHLKKNSWGILEPIPAFCQKISPKEISLALIPALAFDTRNHRLGYGKGYYDRLLPELPLAYGLGFKEQLHVTHLPTMENDQALHSLLLL